MLAPARREVTALRLYSKTPGSDRLRKTAEAELRVMIAAGWEEMGRTVNADHVMVRMERAVAKTPRLPSGNNGGGGGGRQGR